MNDDPKQPKTASALFAPLIARQRELERRATLADAIRGPRRQPTAEEWLLVAEWKSCAAAMDGQFDA